MRRSTSEGRWDGRTVGRRLGFVLGMLSVSPTVRLSGQELANNSGALFLLFPVGAQAVAMGQTGATLDGRGEAAFWNPAGLATIERRSEEHTSELQSRFDLVCRLLLEKKKHNRKSTSELRSS